MSLAMPIILILLFGAGFLGFALGRRQLPPSSSAPSDNRLAEHVERLEYELQRLKDQADFTERLLTERGSESSEDAPAGDAEV